MKREDFKKLTFEKVLVIDGAMGTVIQAFGLQTGGAPEEIVLENPDLLKKVHDAYISAGADIILTNTFGGSPIRLADYGLDEKTEEINLRAAEIARECAGKKIFVGASVGPSGSFLEPIGKITFDEAYENFYRQGKGLAAGKPDLVIFETFSDIREIKAAIIAVRDALDEAGLEIPLIAQMTFAEDGRTVTGTNPEAFVVVMEALGVDGIGVNCSVGPSEMLPVVRAIAGATHLPISVEPNAGLPSLEKGRAVFKLSPNDFKPWVGQFLQAGASLVGSCCGTTPEFTKVISEESKGFKPFKRAEHNYLRLAGRTKAVSFAPGKAIGMIGERINPAGRKTLKAQLVEGKMELVRSEAGAQEKAGAAALDVNISAYKADEKELMCKAVKTVQTASSLPLLIDNSNPVVVEKALKEIEGKALINSTSGEQEKLDDLLPLAVKYGAGIIGIALDETGIPETVEGRFNVAQKICIAADKAGLALKDLILDALVLAVSTGAENTAVTLETLKKIKNELGRQTVLGVSNVSFGLPERSAMNGAFLTAALEAGLDLPIVDPADEAVRNAIFSFNLLKGNDTGGKEYIAEMTSRTQTGKIENVQSQAEEKSLSPLDRLKKIIISGEKDLAPESVKAALENGLAPLTIVNNALVPAMSDVGKLFNDKIYFLPQVLLSAEAMKESFEVLKDKLAESGGSDSKGTVVIATVKGDVHDLGKNIVITLLESHGYKVIDLGKSVAAETVLDAAVRENASCIALSSLMTTTMGEMKTVVELFRTKAVNIPILIGGAVVTKAYADEIGAHYGKDAIEAVEVVGNISRKK
jgi:5-methyltetrahydrofolate--homocysteine methyltransferase